eukprot:scaffold332984_cov20-Prasinocladus_malaysianus.AAC.1
MRQSCPKTRPPPPPSPWPPPQPQGPHTGRPWLGHRCEKPTTAGNGQKDINVKHITYLAAIRIAIAATNVFCRLNVSE